MLVVSVIERNNACGVGEIGNVWNRIAAGPAARDGKKQEEQHCGGLKHNTHGNDLRRVS
jgi:hypothetical protein